MTTSKLRMARSMAWASMFCLAVLVCLLCLGCHDATGSCGSSGAASVGSDDADKPKDDAEVSQDPDKQYPPEKLEEGSKNTSPEKQPQELAGAYLTGQRPGVRDLSRPDLGERERTTGRQHGTVPDQKKPGVRDLKKPNLDDRLSDTDRQGNPADDPQEPVSNSQGEELTTLQFTTQPVWIEQAAQELTIKEGESGDIVVVLSGGPKHRKPTEDDEDHRTTAQEIGGAAADERNRRIDEGAAVLDDVRKGKLPQVRVPGL